VRRAQEQAERIGNLVDRLLDVSQLASGRLKLDLSPCDLGEMLKDVAERLSEQASTVGSELRLSVGVGISLRADKFRLEEALSNVVSNAIKYGSGRPIDIQLKTKDANAILAVQDRGIGIPAGDLSRIFGRFERTALSRNYGGLGLGLYIASQIVEQHGGSIKAENRSGGGTSFIIELPRIAASDAKRKD
jgi:signal transduction histidine kinase